MTRPIRIVGFSGYLGDRFSAFEEAMACEDVDVLVGDYLAEFTLAALSARRDRRSGFVDYFLAQLAPHVDRIAALGRKVVVNAGGFDPAGLADEVRRLAGDLRVAHVEGDDILGELDTLARAGHDLRNLDSGEPLAEWGHTPLSAHAYLGGWGIAAALEAGADIVVCGRVTDASLTVGPAAWWHGWSANDWDRLAGAVVAGHIIECTAHATGGNFSGFREIPDVLVPAVPIAEVAADGSSVITKHPEHGGAVTTDTVTAQLVYEIQGPRYLNPDVTVDLEGVRLEQITPDRVAVDGATGAPPSPTTKVALFAHVGYQAVMNVYVTGIDAAAKIDLLRTQVEAMVTGVTELEITPLGVAAENPASQWEATIPVRIMATAPTREPLEPATFAGRIMGLYLSSYPGFYHDTAAPPAATGPRPRVDYWPAVLDIEAVRHEAVLDDGERIAIAPPPETAPAAGQPVHAEPAGAANGAGETRVAALGSVAYARAGDKGANSNVGIWARDERAWPWLRDTLTTERLRELAPEFGELDIVRHEFPHLRAVHFVLRGLLAPGGSSNLRVDQVGKAVGEYLRSKQLPIPVALLEPEAALSAR